MKCVVIITVATKHTSSQHHSYLCEVKTLKFWAWCCHEDF